MRLLKYALLLALMFVIGWADLPDRLHAEQNGVRRGTLINYHEEKYKRRPWVAEVRTDDGEVIRNSDSWKYRWVDVGAATAWTRADHVYVGGILRRWFPYILILPLLVALMIVDLWRWARGRGAT